jgi:hypothetical protein
MLKTAATESHDNLIVAFEVGGDDDLYTMLVHTKEGERSTQPTLDKIEHRDRKRHGVCGLEDALTPSSSH